MQIIMVLLFIEGTYNVLNGDKFVSQVMRFVVRFVNFSLTIVTRFLQTGDAQGGNLLRHFRGSYFVMHPNGLLSPRGSIIRSLEARTADPFTFQNCSNSFLFQNHPT